MTTRYMFRGLLVSLAGLCWLGGTLPAAQAQKEDKPPETRDVRAGDITLSIPKAWKDKGSTEFRLVQYEVPRAENDESDNEPTEFAVFFFRGSGGSVQDNINRWINQFQPEERTAKVHAGTSPQGDYVLVDLSGTYKKSVGPPVFGRFKEVPDARMLAAILTVEGKGNYFVKLAGPKPTVNQAAEAFRAAFGAVAEKEREYKPEL